LEVLYLKGTKMAQTTILAAGTNQATSTDVVVDSGDTVTIGIFSAGVIPPSIELYVRQKTPSGDNQVARLSKAHQSTMLVGPGTYRVVRKDISALGVSVGVFEDR
jgi:hypothetical protein